MKFGFVATYRGTWPVDVLCEALGVSRSGFYAWRTRAPSPRSRTDATILVTVRASFLQSDRTYGARRVLGDVRDAGYPLDHVLGQPLGLAIRNRDRSRDRIARRCAPSRAV